MIHVDVPVLVPYRPDGAERDANWKLIRENYWGDSPIFEGLHEDGPFNRSAGINAASDAAGDWDMTIIADADSVTDPDKVLEAIEVARKTQKVTFPFTKWVNVHQHEAESFLKTWNLPDDPKRKITPLSNSALFVVPRVVWQRVNGFDENFVGWGYEDMAFITAVNRLAGGVERFPGNVYHLEHRRPEESLPGARHAHYKANEVRFHMYENAILRSDLSTLTDYNRVVN